MNIPSNIKLKLIGVGLLILFVFGMVGLVVISLFTSPSTPDGTDGTPTPIQITPGQTNTNPTQVTPLQKTRIEQTTDNQVAQLPDIINKQIVGDTTIYSLRSREPGETDEIRTRNGVVIYEKTSTETNAAPLPKLTEIIKRYGQPEEIQNKVGDGFYMSGYLYPTQGLAIYANRYTDSVYEVQRFVPMSLNEYKQTYGETLSPAPEMPKEFEDHPEEITVEP